jgi:hypothetical protein
MDARTVDEWYPEFVRWAQGSLVLPDWPRKQDPYWDELKRMLISRRVTTSEAADAVRALFNGAGEPVKFARDFPAGLVSRVDAARRSEAARRSAALATSAAETLAREAHQRECETVWSGLDDASREEWIGLARRRMPFLTNKPKLLQTLAMAWCAFPSDIPPEHAEPPSGFGEPLRKADPPPVRRVLEHDRILDPPKPSNPDGSK